MVEGNRPNDAVKIRPNYPVILSGLAELAGIGAIIAGFFLISLVAGLIASGVALILFAQILDPPNFKRGD